MANRYRARGVSDISGVRYPIGDKFLPRMKGLLSSEIVGAAFLLLTSVVALIWANSPYKSEYFALCHQTITIDLGFIALSRSFQHWINDGLMAVFFFVVGLEIKKEFVLGELADTRRAALPVFAALGGMLAPALIFAWFARGTPYTHGWGIPVATDIAFALGVYGLVGRRLPAELRVFLLAVAVSDDIGAVLVIALFYTEAFSISAMAASALIFGVVLFLRVLGYRPILGYVAIGILFWVAVLKSGVHATIAGVILGILTPARPLVGKKEFFERLSDIRDRITGDITEAESERNFGMLEALVRETESPLSRLERLLQPWNVFLVMPVFALVNAGIELDAASVTKAVMHPAAQGIFFGLLLGKPVGIFVSCWLGVKSGICELPHGVGWRRLLSVACLAGIGFTVSLFVTGLAFPDYGIAGIAKVGVFAGSTISALAALALFMVDRPKRRPVPTGA